MHRARDWTDSLVRVAAVAMCVASVAVPLVMWFSRDASDFWASAFAGTFGLALLIVGSVLIYRARDLTTPSYLDDWGAQPPVCGHRRRRRCREDH